MAETDSWGTVARLIEHRAPQVGLTLSEFYRRAGVSEGTMRKMRQGAPLRSPVKRAGITRALHWMPDAIERILGGESDPMTLVDPAVTEETLRDYVNSDPDVREFLRGGPDLVLGSHSDPEVEAVKRAVVNLRRDQQGAIDRIQTMTHRLAEAEERQQEQAAALEQLTDRLTDVLDELQRLAAATPGGRASTTPDP